MFQAMSMFFINYEIYGIRKFIIKHAKINFIMPNFVIDWDNYVTTKDRPTDGKCKAKVGQMLTPVQNGLIVRVIW